MLAQLCRTVIKRDFKSRFGRATFLSNQRLYNDADLGLPVLTHRPAGDVSGK
jgi:hypothetical protein